MSESKSKNLLLIVLATVAVISTGIAISQFSQKQNLKEQIQVEMANMEEHLLDTYSQIESNLAEISAHEGILRENLMNNETDGAISPEDRIQREIKIIEMLIAENNKLITDLNDQVGTKDKQLEKYSSQVASLNVRVKKYREKAEQLIIENGELSKNLALSEEDKAGLNKELASKAIAIQERDSIIDEKTGEVLDREAKLNAAYYVVGTFQELKSANIVDKEGGIVGIGATKTLKEDFDPSLFQQVDRRQVNIIPVFSKKAELITNHNTNSYEWVIEDEGVKCIKITDHEKFWENSKYLVVGTREGGGFNLAEAK
ncbi:MAG: hypothetical protein HKN22_05160 [Bacteroidia bacterium]|nr:hypothetical protein [Bacteroidia bacterium]